MASAASDKVQWIADQSTQWQASRQRSKRITPEAGRALEILGHAIDYLTDEYVHEKKNLSSTDAQVAAILLLMELNRRVYFECPTTPRVRERIFAFWHVIEALATRKEH